MPTVVTPPFRVSYPAVFQPRNANASRKDQPPKMEYSLEALFPKDADLKALKDAVVEAIKEKWGEDQKKWPTDHEGKSKIQLPFKKQDTKMKTKEDGTKFLPEPYVAGAIFANLKSKQRPGLVDAKNQPIIDEADFYAGCWARAQVNVKAWEHTGKVGVSLWLNHLQKVKDDEHLGGRIKPEDAFEPIDLGDGDGAGGMASAVDIF